MALDITFDNAYELYKDTPTLPENMLPQKLEMLANTPAMMPTDSQPVNLPDKAIGMGFFQTFKEAAKDYNEFVTGYNYLSDKFSDKNPLDDDIPDGWTVYQTENFEGYPEKYWPKIAQAKTPGELEIIKQDLNKRIVHDEEYENGSLVAKLLGGIAGAALSPTTYIPIAGALKYAKTSQHVLKNMARITPGLGASALAHNYYDENLKGSGDLEKIAVDTFRDTIFGAALVGSGLGLGKIMSGHQVYSLRKQVNLNYEGIDVNRVIKDGIDTGKMKAVPSANSSVSAQQVKDAQVFLDSSIARQGLFKFAATSNLIGKFNPSVRMMSSRFPTLRSFAERVADHALETEGQQRGVARPENFEENLWKLRGDNKAFLMEIKGLWHEANGIDSSLSPIMALKALKQRLNNEQSYNYEEFGEEVINTIITGESHSNKSINTAAEKIINYTDEVYAKYRQAYGLSGEFLPPRTAIKYFMRSYNHDQLVVNKDIWKDVVSTEYAKQDEFIATTMAPIRQAQRRLESLQSHQDELLKTKNISDDEVKTLSDRIENQKKTITRLNDELANEIHQNDEYKMLVDNPQALSADESMALKKLLEPKTKLQKERNKIKENLASLKQQLSRAKTSRQKAKTKTTAQKWDAKLKELEPQINKLETEFEKAENAFLDEQARLNGLAQDGQISQRFFTKNHETGLINFKDPNDKLTLRKEFDSHDERIQHAEAAREVILNHTPEQLAQHVMQNFTGPNKESPIKMRSILIPDTVLYENGFLHTNLDHAVTSYSNFLGKKTILKNIFKDVTIDGGIEPMVAHLRDDYKAQEAIINSIQDEAKRKKAMRKLNKDFNNAKQDMAKTYDVMMGRTNGSKQRREAASILRNFAVATRLGAVPLTMVVEPAAIAMKHGLWPTFRDGLIPWLKNVDGLRNTPRAKAYRENAAQASLALEHVLNGYTDKLWNSDAVADVPVGGKIASAMESFAHISGNLAGTNQIDNFLQRTTANIVQGKIIKSMNKYVDGTISAKEQRELLQAGLDPKIWAERFVNQWKEAGSDGNGLGGYLSHFYNWSDLEAMNKMGFAIRRGVRDTILKRGMLSSPFVSNDPVLGFMFLFKGWAFEAFSRYTMPLMQRPDAQKLLGVGLMLGMGALVDPLRRMARGESAYKEEDEDGLFWNALSNSGVLGILTDAVEDANILSSGRLLKGVKNDRYRNRTVMGILGGPAGGIADDMVRITNMLATQNFNTHDMNKLVRLLPFTQIWQLRGLSNKFVESLDLPQTERQAQKQKQAGYIY